MKFTHTLSAAKTVEERTWAVADGLVQDFQDAKVTPGVLEFKEAAEALGAKGFSYSPKTLGDYWRVATTFGKTRRRSSVSVKVYEEIIAPLWPLLDEETRSNDVVSYATQFFASGATGALAARAWAKAQADALRAERKAAREEEQKKAYREELETAQELLDEAIASGKRPAIEKALAKVNDLRGRLGLDLLKVEFADEEAHTETDTEATKKSQADRDAEAERQDALSEWEKDLARLGMLIRYVGNTYKRVREHLNEDDRAQGIEDLARMSAQIQVLSNDLAGEINEEDLQAALADWASE